MSQALRVQVDQHGNLVVLGPAACRLLKRPLDLAVQIAATPRAKFCRQTRVPPPQKSDRSGRSSACSGVFEFTRLTAHSSRVGASKFIIVGAEMCAARSVNAAPVEVFVAARGPTSFRKVQRGQIAFRLIGVTLGPPNLFTSSPEISSIKSVD